MPKKIIKPIEPIHDERCGICFYNLQSVCKRDPAKCDYNLLEINEASLYEKLCANCPEVKRCHEECTFCEEYYERLGKKDE